MVKKKKMLCLHRVTAWLYYNLYRKSYIYVHCRVQIYQTHHDGENMGFPYETTSYKFIMNFSIFNVKVQKWEHILIIGKWNETYVRKFIYPIV